MKAKKIILGIIGTVVLVGALGAFSVVYLHAKDSHIPINYSEVPAPAQQMLSTYFDGQSVAAVTLDAADETPEYEVTLSNGIKVETDAQGVWEEMSTTGAPLPLNALPQTISSYLTANGMASQVVKMEQSRKGYKVKLANGSKLKFSPDGTLISVDR